MITKPPELIRAQLIIGLCERFHKLPSEILAEPAEFIGMLQIESWGRKEADA